MENAALVDLMGHLGIGALILAIILAVLWLFLPFSVFAIRRAVDKSNVRSKAILEELRLVNANLQALGGLEYDDDDEPSSLDDDH